jgi:hypothetical protein
LSGIPSPIRTATPLFHSHRTRAHESDHPCHDNEHRSTVRPPPHARWHHPPFEAASTTRRPVSPHLPAATTRTCHWPPYWGTAHLAQTSRSTTMFPSDQCPLHTSPTRSTTPLCLGCHPHPHLLLASSGGNGRAHYVHWDQWSVPDHPDPCLYLNTLPSVCCPLSTRSPLGKSSSSPIFSLHDDAGNNPPHPIFPLVRRFRSTPTTRCSSQDRGHRVFLIGATLHCHNYAAPPPPLLGEQCHQLPSSSFRC